MTENNRGPSNKPSSGKNTSGPSESGSAKKKGSHRRRRRRPRKPQAAGENNRARSGERSQEGSKPSETSGQNTTGEKKRNTQRKSSSARRGGPGGVRSKRNSKRRRRRGGSQKEKRNPSEGVAAPPRQRRKAVQKMIQKINQQRSIARNRDGKTDAFEKNYQTEMQGHLDPFMATLPFRVDSASRETIPDVQKPVLFLFATQEQAVSQSSKIKSAGGGSVPVRVAIKSEGPRVIAELVDFAKVYTGASWFENHRRRAEDGYYQEVFDLT